MQKSTNYKANLPEGNNVIDISVLNKNITDIIDKGLILDVGDSTGNANNYVLNLGSITLTSANKGISFKFWADKNSTGAVKINGTYNLVKANGKPIKNIKKNAPYTITYDRNKNFFLSSGGADESDSNTVGTDGSKVLEPHTFIGSDGEVHTGTMPNKGAITANLNCGGSYTIPAGYHNGSGKVTANSLASQTGANATAGDILKDKTAWVNGSKLTGTIDNKGSITPGNSIVQSGDKLYCRMPRGAYLTNASSGYPEISYPQGDVATALGLTADKIISGSTICGIAGTYKSANDIWAYTPGTIDLPETRTNTTIVSIPFEPSIVIAFSSTETGKHYSTTNPLEGDIRWGNGTGRFFKIMSGKFAIKYANASSNRTCINDVTYSDGKLTIYSRGSYGGSDYRYTFMIIAIK